MSKRGEPVHVVMPNVDQFEGVVWIRINGMEHDQAIEFMEWRNTARPGRRFGLQPVEFLGCGPTFYSAMFKPEAAALIKAWLVERGWWDDETIEDVDENAS